MFDVSIVIDTGFEYTTTNDIQDLNSSKIE